MSEEQNIPEDKSENKSPTPAGRAGNNENVKEHFPEDSHAPQFQPSTTEHQNTDMETHAHHLHKAPGKKIWHYLFEFFMLFLAVFCGFLAEYQLEHKIEKIREKQFMASMIQDLASDTSAISILDEQRTGRLGMYDSLSSAIIEKRYSAIGSAFYYWGRNISRRAFFFSADGTSNN